MSIAEELGKELSAALAGIRAVGPELRRSCIVFRAVCRDEGGGKFESRWRASSEHFPGLLGVGPCPELAMLAFDAAVQYGRSQIIKGRERDGGAWPSTWEDRGI